MRARLGDLKLLIRNTDPGGSVCTTDTQECRPARWKPAEGRGEAKGQRGMAAVDRG